MTNTKRILIDVDTQFDFMDPNGSLYVEADPAVQEHIKNILMSASIDGIGETYDAIIGSVDSHAYDAWEFAENGGPFPAHCVKGSRGWLRTNPDFPAKQRFVPMTPFDGQDQGYYENGQRPTTLLVGGNKEGRAPRKLSPKDLATEAVEGKVGLYFEKEVYSLFDNPFAMPVLHEIGFLLGGDWNDIQIDVIGYCTGGYCVDAAVQGLLKAHGIHRANIRVLSYATAAIGGAEGMAKSKAELTKLGAEWVEA
jgi:nicotinamidase/pyrazinamidase